MDISDKSALKQYLISKGLFTNPDCTEVKYFSGGVSGTVALVEDGTKQMIVKQALSKLKVKDDWFSDQSRMVIERDGNEVYHQIAPEYTPAVYFFDSENYIYGREAAPESCVMWKTQLLDGLLDFRVAKKAISVLADIHNATASNKAIEDRFSKKSIFYDLRINPYIEFTVQKHPKLKEFAEPIIHMLMEDSLVLVHGDYSPKNILVDDSKIYVLDFEVAHYGHPSFDIAFFCNHFMLKAVKNKVWSDAYLNMLDYMTNIYFEKTKFMDNRLLEEQCVKVLSLLLLARVDGKSPAEYITEESDKSLIRDLAFSMIENECKSFKDALTLAKGRISK